MSCVFCFAPLTHGVTICLGKRLELLFGMFDNQRSTLGGRAHMLRGRAARIEIEYVAHLLIC
jgi:hypothetical protein